MVQFFVAEFSHIPQLVPYLLQKFHTFLKWYHFFSALCSNSEYRFQSHFLHRYLLVPKSQKGAKFVGGLRGPGVFIKISSKSTF